MKTKLFLLTLIIIIILFLKFFFFNYLNLFFLVVFFIFSSRIFLALSYKSFNEKISNDQKIDLISSFYNEDEIIFQKFIKSICLQSFPVNKVILIDDGSSNSNNRNYAKKFLTSKNIDHKIIIHKRNKGQREGYVTGSNYINGDLVFFTDADTVLDKNCIKEIIKPFNNQKIVAVCGNLRAENLTNFITKLCDSRFLYAFEFIRAGQSRLRSVLCVSGPIGAYRSKILKLVLKDKELFLNHNFLGKKVIAGDDRHLTTLVRKYGDVIFQKTACAKTLVKDSFLTLIRQQLRWNRSFLREYFFLIRYLPIKNLSFVLYTIDMALYFTPLGILILLISGMFNEFILIMSMWCIYNFFVTTILLGLKFFIKKPINLIFGIFSAIGGTIFMIPIKILSIVTITNSTW